MILGAGLVPNAIKGTLSLRTSPQAGVAIRSTLREKTDSHASLRTGSE